jgi:hypothetical protein
MVLTRNGQKLINRGYDPYTYNMKEYRGFHIKSRANKKVVDNFYKSLEKEYVSGLFRPKALDIIKMNSVKLNEDQSIKILDEFTHREDFMEIVKNYPNNDYDNNLLVKKHIKILCDLYKLYIDMCSGSKKNKSVIANKVSILSYKNLDLLQYYKPFNIFFKLIIMKMLEFIDGGIFLAVNVLHKYCPEVVCDDIFPVFNKKANNYFELNDISSLEKSEEFKHIYEKTLNRYLKMPKI